MYLVVLVLTKNRRYAIKQTACIVYVNLMIRFQQCRRILRMNFEIAQFYSPNLTVSTAIDDSNIFKFK